MSGDLARKDVTPYPKAIQTATRAKKNGRPKATAAKWAGIVAEKQGPCILLGCGAPPPNDMHHAIPRDRGGVDVAENCVPVCRKHHELIESGDYETRRLFVESLWFESQEPGPQGGVKDTYSWGIDMYGEGIWERTYNVTFEGGAAA